jgi:arabinogalactan endo-1,4-beta-galactosidase
MQKDSIYLAMSSTLWHEMDLVSIGERDEQLDGCSHSEYLLIDGFQAVKYSCKDNINICYLPINEDRGLIYKAYNDEGIEDDFCNILKQNGISNVSLRSY